MFKQNYPMAVALTQILQAGDKKEETFRVLEEFLLKRQGTAHIENELRRLQRAHSKAGALDDVIDI